MTSDLQGKWYLRVLRKVFKKTLPLLSTVLKSMPAYDRLVATYCFYGKGNLKRNPLAILVRQCFWHEYWMRTVGQRLDIQTMLMGEEKGVAYAKNYQKIPFPPAKGAEMVGALDWHDACPFVKQVEALLDSKGKRTTVIQLGASSGREIAYFSNKYPRHEFFYTDIFDSVVEYARNLYSQPNLRFLTCSAENLSIIASLSDSDDVVIFSSGSAQFVYPEHLDLMFYRLSRNVRDKTIQFVVNEPGDELDCNPLSMTGSKPRGNFSYTHNYSFYAKKHQFSLLHWELISPYHPQSKFPEHFGACLLSGVFCRDRVSPS